MSFDPLTILNSPWGPAPKSTKDTFPALPSTKPANIMDAPPQVGVDAWGSNAWGSKPKIVPDQGAAAAQLIQNLTLNTAPASASVQPKTSEPKTSVNPYDPETPGFNARLYYSPYSKEYKCPYPRCNKRHQSERAFLSHLRSPAHRDERLQCHICLNYFKTATALTQHCESQGIRCNVRNTARYDVAVEGMTSGTATVDGRHADDTVKYAINTDLFTKSNLTPVEALIAKHRAEGHARAEEKLNYHLYRENKW